MPSDKGVLLLSLKPRFATMILEGIKTVELRRVAPTVQYGQYAYIYASAPVCQLVGICRVVDVKVASIAETWERYGQQCALTEEEYMSYFEGARRAVAIVIDSPAHLLEPPSLKTLRQRMAGFTPPQSFRYLNSSMLEELKLQTA